MRRGLVIGKFLPIHNGHIALIEFAAAQCDELIVSMSYTPTDPIDPQLRFSWIKEIFQGQPSIKPAMVLDDFDDESLPLPERTKIWAEFIKKTYPPVQVLFSSEEYGEPFAFHLNADHKVFDPGRKQFPVSATLIRQKPSTHWDFIPAIVRPHFVKKVCFYGPESTGKSTLAETMAKKYNTTFVPEVAREFLITNDFSVDDIIRIGIAHDERIQQKLVAATKILFCDTDAITTQIYSEHYLGVIPPVLYELEEKTKYDHYFLLHPDVPWVADGLRDLGDRRKEMFTIFQSALDKRKIPYTHVQGTFEERLKVVGDVIESLLKN